MSTVFSVAKPLAGAAFGATVRLKRPLAQGIPAGLPSAVRADARIANKTGEISIAAHDAGLVFLRDRKPYVLAVLTEPEPASDRRWC